MTERDFIKGNLLSQIEDLQRRVAELERFARVLDDGHVGVVNNLYDATDGGGLFDGDDDLVAPNGARIAGGLYVGSTATEPPNDCIRFEGNLIGKTTSLADDTAMSFTPAQKYGMIMIFTRGGVAQTYAQVEYRCPSVGAFAVLMLGSSNVSVTTGTLNGTTGADGKFTISAHTDGKLYLENRLGGALDFHYILFGA